MHRDMKTMLELQALWDRVMEARRVIAEKRKAVAAVTEDLDSTKRRLTSLEGEIKGLKLLIAARERELKEYDARISRLEEKRRSVRNERELAAVEKEMEVIRFEIGEREEQSIALLDDCDRKEKERTVLLEEVSRKEAAIGESLPALEAEIVRQEEIEREHEARFHAGLAALSDASRAKFAKMIQGKDGKGIARLDGETCEACHCAVPAQIAIEAGKGEALVACTNCGRYLFR